MSRSGAPVARAAAGAGAQEGSAVTGRRPRARFLVTRGGHAEGRASSHRPAGARGMTASWRSRGRRWLHAPGAAAGGAGSRLLVLSSPRGGPWAPELDGEPAPASASRRGRGCGRWTVFRQGGVPAPTALGSRPLSLYSAIPKGPGFRPLALGLADAERRGGPAHLHEEPHWKQPAPPVVAAPAFLPHVRELQVQSVPEGDPDGSAGLLGRPSPASAWSPGPCPRVGPAALWPAFHYPCLNWSGWAGSPVPASCFKRTSLGSPGWRSGPTPNSWCRLKSWSRGGGTEPPSGSAISRESAGDSPSPSAPLQNK